MSRLFSKLQREGLLESHQREVELEDIATLRLRLGAWVNRLVMG